MYSRALAELVVVVNESKESPPLPLVILRPTTVGYASVWNSDSSFS